MSGRPVPAWRGSRAAGALVPTLVQDDRDGTVLMLGWSNRASYGRLRATRELVLFSRSRGRLWRKGESSGNTAQVVSARWDCDRDALLVRVAPSGPICHTGRRSCFDDGGAERDRQLPPALAALVRRVKERAQSDDPGSYTASLLRDDERRLKKVGEEAVELVVAAGRGDPGAVRREAADLLYHVTVALEAAGVDWAEVLELLAARQAPDARAAGGALFRPSARGSGAAGRGGRRRGPGRARRPARRLPR